MSLSGWGDPQSCQVNVNHQSSMPKPSNLWCI